MKFEQPISMEDVEGVTHNPDGEVIQTHELPSGELLITFDSDWATQNDWLIDDVITFVIDEESGKLDMINKSKNERSAVLVGPADC
jgi:hypothetical protein